jgi:hypothetical protein
MSVFTNQIPSEVWQLILINLDYRSIRFATVSVNFYEIVFQCVTSLGLVYCDYVIYKLPRFELGNVNDEFIRRFVNLQELNYSLLQEMTKITNYGIQSLKNLTHLNLNQQERITDEGIKELRKLTTLYLSANVEISNHGIKNLTNLTSLNLNRNNLISDDGIKGLIKLTVLNISSNKSITDNGIKGLTNLKVLILTSNSTITYEGIKDLICLNRLEISYSSLGRCSYTTGRFVDIIDRSMELDFY